MENDVLRNKIAPWQEKGRWYKITILSDGTNYSIDADNTDISNITVSQSAYISPVFKRIYSVDVCYDVEGLSSATNYSPVQYRIYPNGSQGLRLTAPATTFKRAIIWVFGELL